MQPSVQRTGYDCQNGDDMAAHFIIACTSIGKINRFLGYLRAEFTFFSLNFVWRGGSASRGRLRSPKDEIVQFEEVEITITEEEEILTRVEWIFIYSEYKHH